MIPISDKKLAILERPTIEARLETLQWEYWATWTKDADVIDETRKAIKKELTRMEKHLKTMDLLGI